MLNKQDRQGARRPADLERRYNLQGMRKSMDVLEEGLDQSEVFRLLTDGGKKQGVFTASNGQVYVNAEYIVSLSKMFAKDITMTGTFKSVSQGFLPPTYSDVMAISEAIRRPDLHQGSPFLCDLNQDGVYDQEDVRLARGLYLGSVGFDECAGITKSTVTMQINMSDPDKIIRIFGKNMWGTEVDTFVGATPGNSSFAPKDYVESMIRSEPGDDSDLIYRYLPDGTKEWLNPPMTEPNVLYRTYERCFGSPVYTALLIDISEVPSGYTVIRKVIFSHYFGDFVQVWMVANGD